jgi:hypothetical protein
MSVDRVLENSLDTIRRHQADARANAAKSLPTCSPLVAQPQPNGSPRSHIDHDLTRPCLSRQQGCLAEQTLRGLRPADELAAPLGTHLGRGEVLLGRLPSRQGRQRWLRCATS